MREIKFRGWSMYQETKWVYGNLCGSPTHPQIEEVHQMNNRDEWWLPRKDVDPKSVGQYTGCKDKNGKEIYEGDIVKFYQLVSSNSDIFEEPDDFITEYVGKVVYEEEGFVVEYEGTISDYIPLYILTKDYRAVEPEEGYLDYCHNLEDFPFIKDQNDLLFGEVIGNVYENKDLLEE